MRLFIFGAGFSGRAIAGEMRHSADDITGTTRSVEKAEDLSRSGMYPLLFDGETASGELAAALSGTTHLVQSIAPGETGDPILRLFGSDIRRFMPELRWIAYLSTVGVYGNHDGAWVNEDSECRPVSKRSLWRAAAEAGWQELARETGLKVAILRLSGIYGPGRNTFLKLGSGTARRLVKPGQVFNRIHVADIAGATRHLAEAGASGLWNVTDDEPAPPQDVVFFASRLMGVAPPPEVPFADAELTPMARSFYGENKRVSNTKLKASGYAFRFPDYRVALESMWADGSWREQSAGKTGSRAG